MTWRNVAIGEIPEVVVYRNPKGTFTRPVTAAVIAAVVIQLLVRADTTQAVPFYGVGVFLPIFAMGLAIRKEIELNEKGKRRRWGMVGASIAAGMALFVFVGQIIGKWTEGGWIVLISLTVLVLMAHAILLSPVGYRNADQIYRIVRTKSRVEGPMGNIVEWQSLRTQEYRYNILVIISKFWELFGVRRPIRYEKPLPAGDYDEAVYGEGTKHPSYLSPYLNQDKEKPRLGGRPSETAPPEEKEE